MNAERLLAHYEKIADAPDAIARLRRFVLDLAVRGKLVPQDADRRTGVGTAEADREGEGAAGEGGRDQDAETDPGCLLNHRSNPLELALVAACRNRRVELA